MLVAKKIRLKPTAEQELLFFKSAGVARWAYNFFLGESERIYKEYIENGRVGKKNISEGDVRKYINNVLKPTTHFWLKEVGSNVMKHKIVFCETYIENLQIFVRIIYIRQHQR